MNWADFGILTGIAAFLGGLAWLVIRWLWPDEWHNYGGDGE